MALLATALLAACGMFGAEAKPPRLTLEDAPVILDVSDTLLLSFSRLEPELAGYTKEDLGLFGDASEIETFQSQQPFQRVFLFLRIIDNEAALRQTVLTLLDEADARTVMSTFLREAANNIGGSEIDLEIRVSYPDVAAGAILAEGEISTDNFTLQFDMLRFRSRDGRVFVYVNSIYSLPGQASVVTLGREIEQRIEDFGNE